MSDIFKVPNLTRRNVIALFALVFLFAFIPIRYDEIKFAALAILAALILYINRSSGLRVNFIETIFLLLVLYGFLSFLWIGDYSHFIKNQVMLLISLPVIRCTRLLMLSTDFHVIQSYLSNLWLFLAATSIGFIVVNPFISDGVVYGWGHYFGYNQNYVCAYLLVISPYYFLRDREFSLSIVNILFLLLLLLLSFMASAKGCIVVAICFIMYLFSKAFGVEKHVLRALGLIGIVVVGIVLLRFDSFKPIVQNDYRFSSLVYAFNIFLESPLLGSGSGSYEFEIMKYSNTSQEVFLTGGSHNLWARTISEFGFVGILLLGSLCYHLVCIKISTQLKLASSVSLLIYFALAVLYRSAYSSIDFFSSMHIFMLVALGILSTSNDAIVE